MKTVGLITEYNPFHTGHAYHIEKAKELTGADFTIAVMSGDFVQRGTPALLPKHTRAEMALLGGIDLVLELPVQYATASAELFAHGGISILDKLGVVDTVCFGCECGEAETLMNVAQILIDEPQWYQKILQDNLKKGLSFPAARAAALPEYSIIMQSPNNILGIEYSKALLRLKSDINPLGIKRKGNDYHETALNDTFASASALREHLMILQENFSERTVIPSHTNSVLQTTLENTEISLPEQALPAIRKYFPEQVYDALNKALSESCTMNEDDFSEILVYRLMMAESPNELCQYADMSRELAARIYKNRNKFRSFSQFADLVKTREITRTRINRALLHLILNIKKDSVAEPYARILGFRKSAVPLLNEIKKKSQIPILSKTADFHKILNAKQQLCFQANLNASMIFESIQAAKMHHSIESEHVKQISII